MFKSFDAFMHSSLIQSPWPVLGPNPINIAAWGSPQGITHWEGVYHTGEWIQEDLLLTSHTIVLRIT